MAKILDMITSADTVTQFSDSDIINMVIMAELLSNPSAYINVDTLNEDTVNAILNTVGVDLTGIADAVTPEAKKSIVDANNGAMVDILLARAANDDLYKEIMDLNDALKDKLVALASSYSEKRNMILNTAENGLSRIRDLQGANEKLTNIAGE